MTKSEKFDEIRHLLLEIKKRLEKDSNKLEGVVIDNCCNWNDKILSVFTHLSGVKLDLFHAIQRVTSKIPKKTPKRALFSRLLGQVFRQLGDIGCKRTKPTPDPQTLMRNLGRLERHWGIHKGNTSPLNIPAVRNEINKLQKHIVKGCLSNIPAGIGTNRNEALHKQIRKKVGNTKISPAFIYAKLFQIFHEHNNRIYKMECDSNMYTITEGETFGLPVAADDDFVGGTARLSVPNVQKMIHVLEVRRKIGNAEEQCDHSNYMPRGRAKYLPRGRPIYCMYR